MLLFLSYFWPTIQLNLAEKQNSWSLIFLYSELEIKPFGLGFRIQDMEADLIYWWTYLDYFLFLLVSRIGTVGWTERWVKVPKCAVAVWCLASNSLHGGQKKVCLCYHVGHLQQIHRSKFFLWDVWFHGQIVCCKIWLPLTTY